MLFVKGEFNTQFKIPSFDSNFIMNVSFIAEKDIIEQYFTFFTCEIYRFIF